MSDLAKLTERTLGGLRVQSASEKQDDTINMLVYGNSGIGKTRLAASASIVAELSPVLFIDVEGGTFTIREMYPDCDIVRVMDWKDMQKVYDQLYNGTDYKTIVLDSLTEIQKFSMYNIMDDLIKKEPDRDPDVPGMREWGKNTEQIRKLVRAFRDLPYNSIFTALVAEDRNARTGITTKKPSLSGKLGGEVAGFVDIVAYMYIKTVDNEPKRLLCATQTEDVVAKDRSDKLPPVLDQPTMEKIYNQIYKENQ